MSKKYFKERKRKTNKTNHVELFSVPSVVGLATVSSTLGTSSVSFFGISTFEIFDISSVVCTTGEFRCCSSSYSLIKRFLSECALFDEPEGVGEETNGGVELVLTITGGLFALDE